MIPPEHCAEIRRLFFAEHWRIGTIATTLSVHHDTVRQAVQAERFIRPGAQIRPSTLDPYQPFLRRARLARYLLHDGDGTLTDERDGHLVGAHAVHSLSPGVSLVTVSTGGVGAACSSQHHIVRQNPRLRMSGMPARCAQIWHWLCLTSTRFDFY
jgi:hypothetical protein